MEEIRHCLFNIEIDKKGNVKNNSTEYFNSEAIIDADDLTGMMQQIYAIHMNWAWDSGAYPYMYWWVKG